MKAFKHIPGPKSYPIIGNMLGYWAPEVGRNPSYSPAIFNYLNKQHGPLVRLDLPGMEPTVVVFDPGYAELVYRNEGLQPIRPCFESLGSVRGEISNTGGLKGLLSSQKQEWQEFRVKVQKSLVHPRVAKTYERIINEVSTEFVSKDKFFTPDKDFTEELYKWSLESIAAIVLDKRLGCFEEEKEGSEYDHVQFLVKDILKATKKLDVGPKLWQVLPSKTFNKLRTDIKTFSNITGDLIEAAVARENLTCPMSASSEALLGNLKRSGCDEATMTVMSTDLIFGGIEQTSHAVAFTLYLLATNQEVQEKLFQEIQDDQGSSQQRYLRAVVKEGMRLFPPSIGNIRKLEVPLRLGDYTLAPDTVYILAHQTMSRDKTFVRDPERFLPERWIRQDSQKEALHPFLTLPFGWGPRMCIGRRFSEMEIHSLVSKIIDHYQVSWLGEEEIKIRSEIVIFPENELRFNFKKRSK